MAEELRRGLLAAGEAELARDIAQLTIHGRCDCRQRDCGTFYVRPRDEWWGQPLRQLVLEVHRLIAIDMLGGSMVCIEFLGRRDVVEFLDSHSVPRLPLVGGFDANNG